MKCTKCGIIELSSGDVDGLCLSCRNNLLKDTEYPKDWESQGWVCPKCGNVYSPSISECARCNRIYTSIC